MENQYCYVEFEFSDLNQLEDLKSTFEAIKNSKNNSEIKEDRFWLDSFPKYSLEKFTFLKSDLKPDFQTAKASKLTWHFYSLIELLCTNLEVEYIDLKQTSNTNAVLKYDPYSYPYGGISGLIAFIESFNCKPKVYDDGTGVYTYSKNEIKTPNIIWKLFDLKKLFKFSIVILFINLSISCNNKTNSLQFEKDIMYEIYPALMDSVWVKAVLTYAPPPLPDVSESEYKLNKEKESDKRFNAELAEFKKKKFAIDLVFYDKAVVRDNSKQLQEHFTDAIISEKNISDTLEYRFDRKKLDAYKAFHLQYVTKTPRGNERQLYENCCYSVRGVIVFSRIQFDVEKRYGVLTAGIECGPLCGYGYLIFIKKVKEKWVIDKIEKAWIA